MKGSKKCRLSSRILSILICVAMILSYVPLLGRGEGKAYALDPTQGDSITFTPYSSDYVFDRDVFCWEDEENNYYRGSLDFRDGDKLAVTENGEEKVYTFSEGVFFDEDGNSYYVENPRYEGSEIKLGLYKFTVEHEGASTTFNINVIPHPIKEIIYEPVKLDYTDDEMKSYKETYDDTVFYKLPYLEGDKLTIKWTDDKKADSVYTYKNNKFTDQNNHKIESGDIEEIHYYYHEGGDIQADVFPYSFWGSYEEKSFDTNIYISDSAVQSVAFEPAKKQYTDIEMSNRCQEEEGRYMYYLGFELGDKLKIKMKGGSERTYTYKNNAIKELYEGEEVFYDGFVDNDNNALKNEDIIDPYYENREEIVAGKSYEFSITYKGVRAKAAINVIAHPIDGITYEPYKRKYSEAELISREYVIENGKYEYTLPFNYGDKLTIDWHDSKKENTTFVFKEDGLTYKEGIRTYHEDAFVDERGKNEPITGIDVYYPICVTNHRLTADDSPCTFYFEYQDVTTDFNIDITKSSEAEKALAKAKNDALKDLENIDVKYDIYGKIERKELRPAQEREVDEAWWKAMSAMDKASSKAELDKIVAAYEADVKAIKTDAQLKKEEAAAAAAAAAKKAADELAEWNGTLAKSIPAVKSVKFKPAKKKVSVNWKKADKKTLKKFDKVEIQICPDKKFNKSNTKRVEVKKSKKSATVKGLKKGTYYIRVRNVKGTGTAKTVSKWSKAKKIKIK